MSNHDTVDSSHNPWLGRLIVLGVFLLAQGVAMLLVAFIALLVSLEPGWSATQQASLLQPGDARSGSLLLREDGAYTEAIRLGTDIDITVSGPTLRARVTQVFRNPTKDWVEATYVYPLATNGAVDTLKMVVGNRVIVGDIKERQQARVIYEQARSAGQKAALTGASIGQRIFAARAAGGRAALQSGADRAERRLPQGRLRLGCGNFRSRAGPRPHFPVGARSCQGRTGESDQHHRAAEGRFCARRGQEPPSWRQGRESGQRDARGHAE
jgi:hypothetical protein